MERSIRKKVVLGGTFDILHSGHKALLKKAFSLGQVTIGLTSDEMARRSRKREVNKFSERKKALAGFIKNAFGEKARIFKLNDKYGSAPGKDFDYIIVSPATFKTALEINKIRKEKGKKPIRIIKIKFVLGKDGKPLSATKLAECNTRE